MLFGNKSSAVDWLIVGLGNPGQKYEHTRHNMGFLTVDLLAEKAGVKLNKVKFKSAYNILPFAGAKCLVMKPQTYMNLSGESVAPIVRYQNATAADLVVVQDDIDLALGRLRIRKGGSCGGHNGIRNVIERLGTSDFARLKLGVGKDRSDVVAHVLGKFDPVSRKIMDREVAEAVKAVIAIVRDGPDRAMNLFNGFDAAKETEGRG